MSEDNGDVWADEDADTEPENNEDWQIEDFQDFPSGDNWQDQEGGYHELQHGEPENEDAEYRQGYSTFDEARDYINEILTGADQFFDIWYDDETGEYEVYYMGGSE